MSGGSYGGCDGYYEESDQFSRPVFVKPDKSKFLAEHGNVWACYDGVLDITHQQQWQQHNGGYYFISMY